MADNDATQEKGVSDEVEQDTSDIEIDPTHHDTVEDIAERLEAQRDEEEGRDEQTIVDEEVEEEDTEPEAEAVAEEPTEKAEKAVTVDDTLETIVVDGQEQQVPQSKILDAGKRTLQKESAADSRLEEATRLLREAKEQKERLSEDAAPKQADTDLDQLRSEYIHEVQYGQEEDATTALKAWEDAVLSRAQQPATQPTSREDIKSVLAEAELERKIYASPEEGGYMDLMSDPILKEQTSVLVDNLVKQGQGSFDSFDTYKKAGDAIRAIGETLNPEYTPPVIEKKVDTFEEKREKKKKIATLKSANAKTETSEDEDEDQSPSDVIAEMRQRRGQA